MADGIMNVQVVNAINQTSNNLAANIYSSTLFPVILTHPSSVNYAAKVRYKTDSLYSGPDLHVVFTSNGIVYADVQISGDSIRASDGVWVEVASFAVNLGESQELRIEEGAPQCVDDSNCGPCEKCVDGSCVPCDECSDGLGELILYCWDPLNGDTVRQVPVNWSNAEILNVPLGGSGWAYSYRLTCPKGFESGTITITEVWKIPPGVQTDPVVRSVNTTKGAQYVDIQVSDWLNKIDTVAVVPVLAYFSGTVHIGRVGDEYGSCADDLGPTPPEPVKPPPTEPPPTEPPPEPDGGDEPLEIDEPLPPDPQTGTGGGEPPLPPQEGTCECEKYLAQTILAGLQQVRNSLVIHGNQLDARLADGDLKLFQRLSSMELTIYQQLSETNRLLYQLSNWFGNNFFAELLKIRQAVEIGLVKENKAVLESISDNLEFNNKSVAEILDEKDMVVFIENEERVSTQVYRTPDSYVNINQMLD